MILCILQARMSSRRCPGKVLAPVLGEPMMLHQIRRIRRAQEIDELVVATSDQSSDDVIVELCERSSTKSFRGSLDDVLDRFYQAALLYKPDHIVRLTADCPLIDPTIIDATVSQHFSGEFDYTSNIETRSFPDGLDVEICRLSALRRAWREAKTDIDREHVTPYLRSGEFHTGHLTGCPDLSHHRWTVDYPDDLAFIRNIYGALYPQNPDFTMSDILQYVIENNCVRTQNRTI